MGGLPSEIGGVTGAEDANQLVSPETKTRLQGGHEKGSHSNRELSFAGVIECAIVSGHSILVKAKHLDSTEHINPWARATLLLEYLAVYLTSLSDFWISCPWPQQRVALSQSLSILICDTKMTFSFYKEEEVGSEKQL